MTPIIPILLAAFAFYGESDPLEDIARYGTPDKGEIAEIQHGRNLEEFEAALSRYDNAVVSFDYDEWDGRSRRRWREIYRLARCSTNLWKEVYSVKVDYDEVERREYGDSDVGGDGHDGWWWCSPSATGFEGLSRENCMAIGVSNGSHPTVDAAAPEEPHVFVYEGMRRNVSEFWAEREYDGGKAGILNYYEWPNRRSRERLSSRNKAVVEDERSHRRHVKRGIVMVKHPLVYVTRSFLGGSAVWGIGYRRPPSVDDAREEIRRIAERIRAERKK